MINKLSEEEIISQIKDLIRDRESFIDLEDTKDSEFVKDKLALEGILDLYSKEKEKKK